METTMPPNPTTPAVLTTFSQGAMRRLLGSLSVFTMLITIPQVLTIWVGHQAAGVSLLSWSGYLISAVLWFWYGIQKQDRNIYLHAWVGSRWTAPLLSAFSSMDNRQTGTSRQPSGNRLPGECPVYETFVQHEEQLIGARTWYIGRAKNE